MHADAPKLLWDAREALRRIQRFTLGKDFAAYLEDEMLRSAIERQFEIIGEAFAQLRRLDPATASSIAELPRVVDFRNVVIHRYRDLDHALIWAKVEQQVGPLTKQVEALLPAA
ncbi:uncharacterized protein with HEPN domain [Rivibacter subsaxonicus]|uniref:Uncharacterized protein with HEPN domain n=2 Tax=Rivibacter subsaxonicus TaxID=457575 RepID=A0A4Q7VWA3_9BURK|nr:uncharacterized protein with HEPN domain [Rivibacter subsaxonicus]